LAGRTIAIGDIHGCARALETVLRAVSPTEDDLIVTLGDYVDRGPDSRGVIDQLLRLRRQCRLEPLLGNHEVMMLAALDDPRAEEFWLQYGGKETLESYGSLDEIPDEHVEFIRSGLRYFETATHMFLHASYDADLPLARQSDEVILWRHLIRIIPGPHRSGKTAIVGHTPQEDGSIFDIGHLLCIDTFCFGTGFLTALDVDSGKCWQADREGVPRAE
jgi:predicted MPP superfamily phosphohydrolase